MDEDPEEDGGNEPDERTLEEIADNDAPFLFQQALESDRLMKFEDDIEAPAYALCHLENSQGDKGWVVIIGTGSSWEGIEYSASRIFKTRKAAMKEIDDRMADDEEAYEQRRREEDGEQHEGPDASPGSNGAS